MKLYIDTSDTETVVIGLDDQRFTTDSKKEKSQLLLPFIVQTLKSKKKSFADIAEIEVAVGPGSFTGLRVGLSVANALSFALQIPVNGKKVWRGEKVELVYD